jgi:cell division protein FtsI/penicillin-binding protein 2
MQDFKHLTRKKSFQFFRRKPHNNPFKIAPVNRADKGRLRVVLMIIALILALIPLGGMIVNSRSTAPAGLPASPRREAISASTNGLLDSYQSFKLAHDALAYSTRQGDRLFSSLTDGGSVVYSFHEEVQARVRKVMEQQKVPYGVFVAIEPKTGRILALSGYSSMDPEWEKRCFFNPFPMASLFKIVTAAAALEEKKVSPQTVVAFRGRLASENPRYWSTEPRHKSQQMDLTAAMGKSVNPVFGRLASDVVGRDALMTSVERFGFNQALMPGTQLQQSRAGIPQNATELQLMGAGLVHEVRITPLHAAMMIAAIANDGVMLVPSLAKEIRNGKGEVISSGKPVILRRLVSSETANDLSKMLATTVSSGTSRKVFHDRRGRPLLASVQIAAKTGSINGTDPAGHYSWFTAYAPIEDPQIALAAMVVNQGKWKIKASYLGEQALEAFFR